MRIEPLFPTPLIVAQLPGSESLCADLRTQILAREQESRGVARSNCGGWQSTPDFFDWAGEQGGVLRAAMLEVVDHYTGVFEATEIVRKRLDWRVGAWANVNRSGASNDMHYHPASFWSAVFYVDDGGASEKTGGAIEFVDPRGSAPIMYAPEVKIAIAHCASAGLGERYYPKTGELFMFPSWLSHRVTAYSGDGERISIAANFAIPGA